MLCSRIAVACARLGALESGFRVDPWPTIKRAESARDCIFQRYETAARGKGLLNSRRCGTHEHREECRYAACVLFVRRTLSVSALSGARFFERRFSHASYSSRLNRTAFCERRLDARKRVPPEGNNIVDT